MRIPLRPEMQLFETLEEVGAAIAKVEEEARAKVAARLGLTTQVSERTRMATPLNLKPPPHP